jgi:hypothetical protein
MEKELKRLLGEVETGTPRPLPRTVEYNIVSAGYRDAVESVYRGIGGVLGKPPFNPRPSWDLEFDNVAVELDEFLHFNRYRAMTLESLVYGQLPGFPLSLYREYCAAHEQRCLQAGGYGGKWSNRSCDTQFGVASPSKDFSGNGPSRWKQRAYYDFVKDLSPLVIGVKVVRIAVWDTVYESGQARTVAEVLSRPTAMSAHALVQLIRERAA